MTPRNLSSIFAAALVAASGCGPTVSARPSDGGTVDAPPPIPGLTGITVMPPTATLAVTAGSTAKTAYTAIGHFCGQPDRDISSQVLWSTDDPALGGFSANDFVANGTQGGQANVIARNGTITGSAQVTVQLTASVIASGGSPAVPSNAGSLFGGTSDPSRAPVLYYPYDNVVLPPNLDQMEVQWAPGPAKNTLFRLELKGPYSDVSIYTRCVAPPMASSGCYYDLDPKAWGYVAGGSRGASDTLIVQATDDSGSGVGSSAMQTMTFTFDPVGGGIYYWTTSGGSSIMRFDLGGSATAATQYLDPSAVSGGDCVGCHATSHDGTKILANFDLGGGGGNEAWIDLLNVATRAQVTPFPLSQRSQFESWAPDDSAFAGVYGDDGADLNIKLFNGATGAYTGDINLGGWEASHPDWAPDGQSIAFTHVGIHEFSQNFNEGAIALVKKSGTGWGTPVDLVPRQAGINHYYPAFSPDGSILVYDTSTCGQQLTACNVTWVSVDCSCDADADPSATLFFVPAAASSPAPIALAHINAGHPVADKGITLLTNSWPKWSPIISRRGSGGGRVAWLTFSSTRAFGFRPLPSGSDENPSGSFIWMAAVDLDKAEVGTPGDPSYPPFVLPFQDFTTSNHIAQWTTKVVAIQ